MIHDPKVEVTCDGANCRESVFVDLPFLYGGIMHADGRYVLDEDRIATELHRDHQWTTQDGKHFCEDHKP